jgi:hypothetical protein
MNKTIKLPEVIRGQLLRSFLDTEESSSYVKAIYNNT